jgi:hypothetical protein
LVVPPCGGCGELPPDFTPLDAAHSLHVSLGPTLPESPPGTYCFSLEGGIDSTTATIIAAIVEAENGPHAPGTSLETVQWVKNAPNCSANRVEVRTFGYRVEESELVAAPDDEAAFSFVVP